MSVDNLMYVKEDLIIPHVSSSGSIRCHRAKASMKHYTFYDFIVNKARGKSGPLFNFDVHDDVRLLADATKEKDESHAGKVVERSYYQRNKHIFPASRWEVRLCSFASITSNDNGHRFSTHRRTMANILLHRYLVVLPGVHSL